MTPEDARKFIADEAINAVVQAVKSGKPDWAQKLTVVFDLRPEIAEAAAKEVQAN